MYACVYVYVLFLACVHISMCACLYVCMYVYLCLSVCVCMRSLCMSGPVPVHACNCTLTLVCISACVHEFTCVCS